VPNAPCIGPLCFTYVDSSSPRLFGFSEFLAGLALLVLAWTTADVRYRFRVRTAPLPLPRITYWVVGSVGVLTLLTDLWLAQEWPVPQGPLTPALWQALLGFAILVTFLTWAWFAFIHPPIYGKRNARRFARALYRAVLRGSSLELAIVADEVARSANPLIRYATNRKPHGTISEENADGDTEEPEEVVSIADDILLLIADPRFCEVVVESSPGTALALFREIQDMKKYNVQVETFARNIVAEALANRDSFLYHEASGYYSGLMGYVKPLSHAMFADHEMVEAIGTLLDPDYNETRKWQPDQWSTYGRLVKITLQDYAERNIWGNESFTLSRAIERFEGSVSELHRLDGTDQISWDDDVYAKLRVVVQFIRDVVGILDDAGVPDGLRLRGSANRIPGTLYDRIAALIYEVIESASRVKTPVSTCWWIQHNSVWGELFHFELDNPAGKVVSFKVRRLLYDAVVEMEEFPNFLGARILAFCLNVMGLNLRDGNLLGDMKALHTAILSWTKRNYAWLHVYNPDVAEACLVDGMSYDPEECRIIKTYPAEGLRREAQYDVLEVDPPPSTVDASDGRGEGEESS